MYTIIYRSFLYIFNVNTLISNCLSICISCILVSTAEFGGTTPETVAWDVMDRYFEADLADAIADSLEAEGTYKVSGGKLILQDKAGNKVFEGKYDIEEDTLKLKSGVTRPLIASLLPISLEKK